MKEFPIMRNWSKKLHREMPGYTIPITAIQPHETQALLNHDQTLKRLAERGGLTACEAIAVIENRGYKVMGDEVDNREYLAYLITGKDATL